MNTTPETKNFFKRFFSIASLSLKTRLRLVFSSLMVLAIVFSGLLLYQQHKISVLEARLATSTYEDIFTAIRMRENLAEIDRESRVGEIDNVDIANFQKNLATLGPAEVGAIRTRFELYKKSLLASPHSPEREKQRSRFEDVAASLGTYLEVNKNAVYRMADDLNRDHSNSIRGALSFLVGFIILVMLGGNKIISVITEPLTALVKFLDNVDLEKDLPEDVPRFKSEVSEVSLVAKSFGRLLERLRAYKAINLSRLLQEKRRADIIATSIMDGIFLMRGDEVLYMNPKAEKILGIEEKGRTQFKLSELKPSEFNERAASVLKATSSSAMPIELETTVEHRKYHYIVRAYAISRDLIEKIERGANSNLENALDRVQVDTMILAQDVTLVKESQEAKSHFLGTLSHEVKTPVTSLTMATHLLKKSIDQIPNAVHKSLILTCVEDVDRLRRLLDEFLTVSRLDTLTEKIEVKEVNLSNLLKHSVQSFQPQATERGVKLISSVHAPARATLVQADPSKIAWAISNLLTNAIHHTPKGGQVEASLSMQDTSVEVRIRDTGPGIDLSRQDKIFDKFNSFYDIRVARSGGAGVGLSIAKEIIAAHGGKIWVFSRAGQGAEFCFTLPLIHQDKTAVEDDGSSVVVDQYLNFKGKLLKGASHGTTASS